MRQLTAILLFIAALIGEARGINLTPLEVRIEGDGPARLRYYFEDTPQRVGFRIDSLMSVTGSSDLATFRFTDVSAALMRLLRSPTPANTAFDAKGVELYQVMARALLPSGATNIQLLQSIPGGIVINDWKSLQFIYTYEFFGLSYHRAIAFLNVREGEQLVFDVSAPAIDYDKIYPRAYRVLNSFFELARDPGPT